MAQYKQCDYSQSIFVPVYLKDQLMPGTLEFAIHTLVEKRMDLSIFDGQYNNDETGRKAYDPKVLLKIVLLAYSRGIISSRQIERACNENIIFMALACGQCPDHSTIAKFVSSMKDQVLPLFRDVLLVCEQQGLLGGTFFALDGCKLPTNASKDKSGKFNEIRRKKEKIEQTVHRLMQEQIQSDRGKKGCCSESVSQQQQIEKLLHQADRIDQWLKDNTPKKGAQGKERQSNLTDNESAKMHTSHGAIQGYNGQALVDGKHQVVVHAEAFGHGQDHGHLSPMVDGAKKNLIKIGKSKNCLKGKTFAADTNYHTQENLKKCIEEDLDAYIPDRSFRKRDPRFATQKRYQSKGKGKYNLADFTYDTINDRYICPGGHRLRLNVKKLSSDRNIYRRYVADFEDCTSCSLTDKCLRHKNAKRRVLNVPIGSEANNYSKAMSEKVDSEKGRRMYPQRMAIVEPVFANIRTNKRLDRFNLRGKIKVSIQWMLYCMVHNIEKIAKLAPI